MGAVLRRDPRRSRSSSGSARRRRTPSRYRRARRRRLLRTSPRTTAITARSRRRRGCRSARRCVMATAPALPARIRGRAGVSATARNGEWPVSRLAGSQARQRKPSCVDLTPGVPALHEVLRVEMRARRVGTADGVDDTPRPSLKSGRMRAQRRMETEEAVEIEGRRPRRSPATAGRSKASRRSRSSPRRARRRSVRPPPRAGRSPPGPSCSRSSRPPPSARILSAGIPPPPAPTRSTSGGISGQSWSGLQSSYCF